ncbi:hypothetical protein GCM10009557_00490 [Virgisporangium ochraceum]|uniref:DUF4192 domain-containing protein n=1 Tax=Virgisporangium ochraceum TaxID=65505 RepID=A0A8J4EGV0_9ACTN|nr:DUF4192 domain-containing protein [Virgisporangium ochraceum]GIJ74081.1 hypothetical protein Voc01_089980 [Virgisporangium ochraceum]
MSEPSQITIRGPVDLIALVPHLLGFVPTAGDVIVVGMRASNIVMTAGSPLGDLSTTHELQAAVDDLAGPIGNANIDSAAVIGYGDLQHMTPAIDTLHGFLTSHDIAVVEAICVAEGRYHPRQPAEGVADGIPFDATTTTVAAMVHAGSAALPNRAALVEQFKPVTGQDRAAMHAATLRAWHRLRHITARADDPDDIVDKAGRHAAATAYERHNNGDRLTDDEAAWFTVLLTRVTVRDYVFRRTHGHDGHVTLWTDLTRRAEPALAAAPATLLAFAAWRMGNGSVANIALERALDADPEYGMARLLVTALVNGLPAHRIDEHVFLADDPLTRPPTVT